MATIFTDENGKPFEKPAREDFASDADYFDAWYRYRNLVTSCANKSFDAAFRKAMKGAQR